MRLAAAILVLAFSVCRGSDRAELTAGIDEKIATLSNILLRERTSRYSQVGTKVCKLDSLETVVSIADGTEQYSEVRKNHKTYSHVSQIAGVWSFGETVTMLRSTRDALREPVLTPYQVTYHYLAADHRWFVLFDSRTYWLDFDGTVQLTEPASIQRIVWTTGALPPETGIAGISWTVDFQLVDVAGRRVTVPKTAVYRVNRNGNRAEWNVTEFFVLGLYGSESALRFDR